ncbi:MAG: leucine-rich repeat domain-containing protein [Ruminococcus sp.]|nr:leucine-rich repeat domain-containing protein [Ruminococcus sp.]
MRKTMFMVLLAALTAVSVGCSEKVASTSSQSETEPQPETEAVTELDTYEPLATVRDRNIEEAGDFDYEIYEGRTIITKYNGNAANVELPAEIEGVPVCEVGFYCFEANYQLESVTLPETVDIIGEGAFMDCASLSQINIPANLKEVQRGAFVGCVSLSEITLPATVTRVQEEAFTACEGMYSLTIMNPDLAYESWGLEELPNLVVYAPEGSAAAEWAAAMGKLG